MSSRINHDTAAARFRQRAAECVKLAAASIDADVEVQYRTLADQYFKLAECEECVSHERSLSSVRLGSGFERELYPSIGNKTG